MDDNEFLLFDRLEKIKSVINKYGEDKFALSFSGGKDSTVLSWLVDEALPGNRIPRVYSDTGIELNMVRDFVFELQKTDDRIVILKPRTPIKPMLERDGYPFKSKEHSRYVERYQRKGLASKSVRAYIGVENTTNGKPIFRPCPNILKYQFLNEKTGLKISDKCCERLKEEPLEEFAKEHNIPYHISGIMLAEGGRRKRAQCLAYKGTKLFGFHPLVPVNKEWEDWLIQT